MNYEGLRLLLGVSSSISAYRALDVASSIVKGGGQVRVVMTANATRIVGPAAFDAITRQRTVTSVWENDTAGEMDHLAATKWANVFAVVPASANTIAKLAHGIADDALGTFAVAWSRPLIIAPAMNPTMYEHASVQANLALLRARGNVVIEPAVGPTACGDVGRGRLADVADILLAIVVRFRTESAPPLLAGEHVLITSGPTREFADPVRCITNPSTGKMGIALARAARAAGARVTLVTGPTEVPMPAGLDHIERIVTAEQMKDAVLRLIPDATVAIFAAAVSDWRPAERSDLKNKKTTGGDETELRLVRTPDVAAAAGKVRRPGQLFVGFAAESHDLVGYAREKRKRKGFDFVVANDITEPGAGFASDSNHAIVVEESGETTLAPMSKDALAVEIVRRIAALRGTTTGARPAQDYPLGLGDA